jgi:signal recognition particle GTPase
MFENLQDRLGSILNGLTGRGALSESDVSAALREVRRALLEADVSLEVVRSFTDRVREKAVGAEILKSIKPGQMVVKIVRQRKSSFASSALRQTSTPCLLLPASLRPISPPAPFRPPSSAAMTSSFSTPPAVPISTNP